MDVRCQYGPVMVERSPSSELQLMICIRDLVTNKLDDIYFISEEKSVLALTNVGSLSISHPTKPWHVRRYLHLHSGSMKLPVVVERMNFKAELHSTLASKPQLCTKRQNQGDVGLACMSLREFEPAQFRKPANTTDHI